MLSELIIKLGDILSKGDLIVKSQNEYGETTTELEIIANQSRGYMYIYGRDASEFDAFDYFDRDDEEYTDESENKANG
jgi:hypothetical protein